jgi:uncharacterized protein (TIGR02145 family)
MIEAIRPVTTVIDELDVSIPVNFDPHGTTLICVTGWADSPHRMQMLAGVEMPSISSITPTSAFGTGPVSINIVGNGFRPGATVLFNGVAATSVVVVDSAHITCDIAGAADSTPHSITVTNVDTTTVTRSNAFTFNPNTITYPTITSVAPTFYNGSGPVSLSIVGTGFQSGAIVTMNGYTATSVNVVDSAHITCDIIGVVDDLSHSLTVTNIDTGFATLPNAFTFHSVDTNNFVDPLDNQVYRTTTIGGITWFAQNYNGAGIGATSYANNPANDAIYGKQYTFAAAQAMAPAGWHLPTDAEWTALENSVGGASVAAGKLKANSDLWTDNHGTDNYGFSALPGGYSNSFVYDHLHQSAYFWSNTMIGDDVWIRQMNGNSQSSVRSNQTTVHTFSVRYVKD